MRFRKACLFFLQTLRRWVGYVGQVGSRMKKWDCSHVREKLQLPTSDIPRLPAHKSL